MLLYGFHPRHFCMPQIWAFGFSLGALKFSIHNILETRVLLLNIFDIEFLYKSSHFEPFCLTTKMASETMVRPVVKYYMCVCTTYTGPAEAC